MSAGPDRTEQVRSSGGRPRDPGLDAAIIGAAEQRLRKHGYSGMSIDAVAVDAGTTVPAVRRRYRDRAALAAAVIDVMRSEPLRPPKSAPPRRRALAILENFRRNLALGDSMPLLGTFLAEERHHPELLDRFRARLVAPRRAMLAEALRDGVAAGELPSGTDIELVVNMLIGSFYAHYVAGGAVPPDWPDRVLGHLWPPEDFPAS